MHKRFIVAAYRFFFGGLTVAAMAVQLHHTIYDVQGSTANFFSFFTIESNIIACCVFLAGTAFALSGRQSPTVHLIRGAAALYMTITGIVYVVLLSGMEEALQTTVPWVNLVLHYLMPLAVFFDWYIDPPAKRIPYRRALWWLAYPLIYLIYSLVRGPIVGWYPYPFLNPANHGYGGVVITGIGILVVALGLMRLLTWNSQTAGQRQRS